MWYYLYTLKFDGFKHSISIWWIVVKLLLLNHQHNMVRYQDKFGSAKHFIILWYGNLPQWSSTLEKLIKRFINYLRSLDCVFPYFFILISNRISAMINFQLSNLFNHSLIIEIQKLYENSLQWKKKKKKKKNRSKLQKSALIPKLCTCCYHFWYSKKTHMIFVLS